MKRFMQILSYLLAVFLGCGITLVFVLNERLPISKLDQLEALIGSRFIAEYDPVIMEDAAAAAMINALGDRWSYYVPASQFAALQEREENAYVGIGITISPSEDGTGFDIIAVDKNGSANTAGLLVGDRIIFADGQDTKEMSTDDLRNIVRGAEGTTVVLGIVRGEETLEFTVPRMQILTEIITSRMLDGQIGLVTIANFNSRCASDAIAAIEDLRQQGARALIFDVRFNPGGYAHELVQLLDYLLPEGELFRTVDYTGRENVDLSDANYLDLPMAVLCNGDSYSAAEFFAAAIQEYGAGTIVGSPTCGKGYFQYTFQMFDGSAAALSVGKYFTPNGNSLIDVGVQPDRLVEVDDETDTGIYYKTIEPQDDPQLQAAIQTLLAE